VLVLAPSAELAGGMLALTAGLLARLASVSELAARALPAGPLATLDSTAELATAST